MKSFLIFICIIFLINISCNTTAPPENRSLTLSLEDVSCTEAWLRLEIQNTSLPAEVNVVITDADGKSTSQISILNTQDSVLYIDSLLPNKTYKIHSSIHPINQSEIKSNELSITTLDTTSNNFTWQTWTFGGEAGSCDLFDVAIINDTCIVAVGNIFLKDSIGNPDPQPYSLAIWNGEKWEIKKIYFNSNSILAPIKGIFVISPNDIWLAAGSIFHWDGSSSNTQLAYSRLSLPNPNATIEKLWGNSQYLYGVGNAGTVVLHNKGTWQKIESGTELKLNDIWGDYSKETNKWEILVVGGDIYHGQDFERVILNINDNKAQLINNEGVEWPLSSIWFKSNKKYHVVGSGGNFQKNNLNENQWNIMNINSKYLLYKIRGNNFNNIIASGAYGEIIYYNGVSWKSYIETAGLNNGIYYSFSIKNNMVVLVGFNYQSAVITMGKKIN